MSVTEAATTLRMLGRSPASPSRATLRSLLKTLLVTDADLEAFCLDFFFEVHSRFSTGMDRVTKLNLLLTTVPTEQIAACLNERYGESHRTQIGQVLSQDASPPLRRRNELSERIQNLCLDRARQLQQGLSITKLDREIAEIKRQQRQGSQLTEGEILSERFSLLEVIGQGGFAKVWLAFDLLAQQLVAVKVLHADLSSGHQIERFRRGALKMQGLSHPHIVRVLSEPEEYAGFHFFAMEHVAGGDLAHAVTSGRLDQARALRAVLQAGQALEHAHQRGLIHRDVKPGNILLDAEYGAKLTDFDLVWAADTTGGTRTGAMGTFLYAAPEAMEDASRVDCRADVYALGMTALFVLYGRNLPAHLFQDRSAFLLRLDAHADIKDVIARSLAWNPDQRPATATQFNNELERALQHAGIIASNSSPLLQHPPCLEVTIPNKLGSDTAPSSQASLGQLAGLEIQTRPRLGSRQRWIIAGACLFLTVTSSGLWRLLESGQEHPEKVSRALTESEVNNPSAAATQAPATTSAGEHLRDIIAQAKKARESHRCSDWNMLLNQLRAQAPSSSDVQFEANQHCVDETGSVAKPSTSTSIKRQRPIERAPRRKDVNTQFDPTVP
jgi:serine/threonine protein kinase